MKEFSNENTDIRLTAAYEHIHQDKVKLLSLDVFDTLLWRKAPLAVDIFLILGKQLKSEGWLIEAVTAECFVELRVKAEQLARKKKAHNLGITSAEVILKEIYWQLSGIFKKITIEQMVQGLKGIINESDVDDLVALEVALEKQITEFDLNILRLVYYANQKNIPVILVSDTYLDHCQLSYMLDRPTPWHAQSFLNGLNRIFISCEYGRGKRHGLFDFILEEMQVAPENVLHIGDNFNSDCAPAHKAGIAALYYPKTDPELDEVLKREWPDSELISRAQMLDPYHGDFGTSALRAKLAYDTSAQELSSDESFFWHYGATVLGPILSSFTHWVYRRCQELNQSRVFCLMREGHLYAELINQCASFLPTQKLEATELWVSRRFVTHACMVYGHPQELISLMHCHPASPFTVEGFCSYVGLDINKIKPWKKNKDVRLEGEAIRNELASYLCEHKSLIEEILQHAAKRRHRFLKYLSSLVDLDKTSQMVLVDVGWSGTIQGAIQMILQLEGYPTLLHGLYLGTAHGTEQSLMNGNIREGYLIKAGFPHGVTRVVKRGMYALEQTATAGLASMVDIDARGNIVTGPILVSKKQIEQAHLVQEGIRAYCQQQGLYMLAGAIQWDSSNESLSKLLQQMLVRASGYLTPLEARKLGTWSHDHVSGKGATSKHVLGKDRYYEQHIPDMLPEIAFEDWGITWPAAYAAKRDSSLALMTQQARMGTLPKECFQSLDFLLLKVFLNTGSGFSTKATRREEVHSNANRNFFSHIKLSSIKKPITAIRFELSYPNALIRIKSLRMIAYAKNTFQPSPFIFFESEAAETSFTCAAEQVQPNTFMCRKKPLALTYSFTDPDIYALQINICSEVFHWK